MRRSRVVARAAVALLLAATAASGAGFDCSDGMEETWSQPQKDVCCIIKGKGCDSLAKQKAQGEPTTTLAGTSVTIFDCTSRTDDWDKAKQDWCCQHWSIGCSGSAPTKGGDDDQDEDQDDSSQDQQRRPIIYDCKQDLDQWRTKWDQNQQDWCCAHWGLGCSKPQGSSQNDMYECDQGLVNWEKGWSDAKKAYCCQHAAENVKAQLMDGNGCVTATEASTTKVGTPKCEAIVFQHGDMTGWTADFRPGAYDNAAYVSAGAVGKAGAVAVNKFEKGCTAIIYEHGDFTGWSALLAPGHYHEEDIVKLGGSTSIGSIKVFEATLTTTVTTTSTTTTATSSTSTSTSSSTTAKTTTTTLVYDCLEGYEDWRHNWNATKKEYCCQKHGFCHATNTTTTVSSTTTKTTTTKTSSTSTLTTTSTTKTTTTTEANDPYDCYQDLESWETLWPNPKKEWCCANRVLCPGPEHVKCTATVYENSNLTGWKATFAPGDYDGAAFVKAGAKSNHASALVVSTASNGSVCCYATIYSKGNFSGLSATFASGTYDAQELVGQGINDIVSSIRVSETCTTSEMPAADPYDCSEDLAQWDSKWSTKKKAWCCANRVLCPATVTTTTTTTKDEAHDCDAGADNVMRGWSDDKKEWCCEKKGLGCEFDCKAGALTWRTGWSEDKKEYCCDKASIGCPFDCQVARETWKTSWTVAKKDWCCQHDKGKIGCLPTETTLTSTDTATTTTTITSSTSTGSSTTTLKVGCVDTPGWTNGYGDCKTEDKDQAGCTATGYTCEGYVSRGFCSGGKVLQNFTAGNLYHHPELNCCACGGGYKPTKNEEPNEACTDFKDWPDKVGVADCGECKHVISTQSHRTCSGYCQSLGMECFYAAEDHPTRPGSEDCPVKANATCSDDLAAMNVKSDNMICGCLDVKAAQYDCSSQDIDGWSDLKRSWCCFNEHKGCPTTTNTSSTSTTTTSTPTTTSTTTTNTTTTTTFSSTATETTQQPFDCEEDASNLATVWSLLKKSWCCEHKKIGCNEPTTTSQTTTTTQTETESSSGLFDCEAGFNNWEEGWSDKKKGWCCENVQKGCTTTTTMSAPFDCRAGLWNWREGWSDKKKAWCCAHEKLGCQKSTETTSLTSTSTTVTSASETSASTTSTPTTTPLTTPTTSTTPEPSTATTEVTEPFDCFKDLAGWRDKWSSEKKDYCCKNAHSCPENKPDFDCFEDLDEWRDKWSSDKKDYCCNHAASCPDEKKPEFDCFQDLDDWRERWSKKKREYCCRHEASCPPEEDIDCWADISTWEDSWSKEQKEFCCGSRFKCPKKVQGLSRSGSANFPWDSSSNEYLCENLGNTSGKISAGREEARKWCCDNKDVGCREEIATHSSKSSRGAEKFDQGTTTTEMLYDCEEGLQEAMTGWTVAKYEWCCQTQKVGCLADADLMRKFEGGQLGLLATRRGRALRVVLALGLLSLAAVMISLRLFTRRRRYNAVEPLLAWHQGAQGEVAAEASGDEGTSVIQVE